MSNKEYIGDGVYIDCNGYYFILTTEDGLSTMNRIVLEPFVYKRMLIYIKKMENKSEEE